LAITGKKVALMEFDLYNPKITSKLDIEQTPGITEFLKGEASVEEIIKPHATQPNLWVLPCGTLSDNPAELILNGKLPYLMEHLKKEFDIIIMDSPCLGLTTDSKVLADYANVTLYVLRQNYTRKNFLKFINQTYESGNLPNMNLIFNGIKIRKIPGFQSWEDYGYHAYKYRNNSIYGHKKKTRAIKEH
jgi:Mrp family chromosome partitioning ATPase